MWAHLEGHGEERAAEDGSSRNGEAECRVARRSAARGGYRATAGGAASAVGDGRGARRPASLALARANPASGDRLEDDADLSTDADGDDLGIIVLLLGLASGLQAFGRYCAEVRILAQTLAHRRGVGQLETRACNRD